MIRLYTGDGCPNCGPAKQWLENRGVSFREVNVSEDASAMEYLGQMNISSIPVLEFPSEEIPIIGFSHHMYDKEFRKRGM